jgi:hypothetical protein
MLFEFVDKEQKTLIPGRLEKMEAIRKKIDEILLG